MLAAERALTLFYGAVSGQAAAYPSLLIGLKEYLEPPDIIITRGPAEMFGDWRKAMAAGFLPNAFAVFLSNGADALPPSMAKPETPDVNAWQCRGVKCINAVNTPDKLISLCKSAFGY